jgi:small multidrug resistance pump
MGYVFLAIAIGAEVIATTFLKFTSGERHFWWAYPIVVIGYLASFWMLSLTLAHGVPLGIAYALWAAIGVVAVAVISWLVFHESLTWLQVVGLVLVIGGVALLELGGHRSSSAT